MQLIDDVPPSVVLKQNWAYGQCLRTGEKGVFPFDGIYVIPCKDKPPPEFLVCTNFIHVIYTQLVSSQSRSTNSLCNVHTFCFVPQMLFTDMTSQHKATLPRHRGAVMMGSTIGRPKLSEV